MFKPKLYHTSSSPCQRIFVFFASSTLRSRFPQTARINGTTFGIRYTAIFAGGKKMAERGGFGAFRCAVLSASGTSAVLTSGRPPASSKELRLFTGQSPLFKGDEAPFEPSSPSIKISERGGFEPPNPCGLHAFEARAFDHSAISPDLIITAILAERSED